MNLVNAGVLLGWVRSEIGTDVRLWPEPDKPGVYRLDLAPGGKIADRWTRRRIENAIHRHGEELVQLLLDEREQYPAGAELLLWEQRPE